MTEFSFYLILNNIFIFSYFESYKINCIKYFDCKNFYFTRFDILLLINMLFYIYIYIYAFRCFYAIEEYNQFIPLFCCKILCYLYFYFCIVFFIYIVVFIYILFYMCKLYIYKFSVVA